MNKMPYLIDKKFGGKRKMTEQHNTSISALGILRHNPEGSPVLTIYHNIYAAIPLSPELCRGLPVSQFTLEDKVKGQFQNWREI